MKKERRIVQSREEDFRINSLVRFIQNVNWFVEGAMVNEGLNTSFH